MELSTDLMDVDAADSMVSRDETPSPPPLPPPLYQVAWYTKRKRSKRRRSGASDSDSASITPPPSIAISPDPVAPDKDSDVHSRFTKDEIDSAIALIMLSRSSAGGGGASEHENLLPPSEQPLQSDEPAHEQQTPPLEDQQTRTQKSPMKFKVYRCSRCGKVFWSSHDVEGHKTSHRRGAALTPVSASEDAAIPSWPQEIKRTRYYFPLSEWKALKRITPDRLTSSARIDEQD
ncbi:unnamed protein product [Musa hybrid cultivar]